MRKSDVVTLYFITMFCHILLTRCIAIVHCCVHWEWVTENGNPVSLNTPMAPASLWQMFSKMMNMVVGGLPEMSQQSCVLNESIWRHENIRYLSRGDEMLGQLEKHWTRLLAETHFSGSLGKHSKTQMPHIFFSYFSSLTLIWSESRGCSKAEGLINTVWK